MTKRPDNFELFSVFEKNEWLEKALAEAEAERNEALGKMTVVYSAAEDFAIHHSMGWEMDDVETALQNALAVTSACAHEYRDRCFCEAAGIVRSHPMRFAGQTEQTVREALAHAVISRAAKTTEGK